MKFRSLFFTGLFLSVVVCAEAAPVEDGDVGFWLRTDAETALNSKWKLNTGEEIRFREHAGLSYTDTHVGTSWQACKYFQSGADYLLIRYKRKLGKKDNWYWDSEPRVYLTPQITLKGWKFEDRNMLEWRIKEALPNTLRYRQQIGVTAPWKWTRFELQPFASEEFFFETRRTGLVETRLLAGWKIHFYKPLYGALYYLRQSNKDASGKWRDVNFIAAQLKVII